MQSEVLAGSHHLEHPPPRRHRHYPNQEPPHNKMLATAGWFSVPAAPHAPQGKWSKSAEAHGASQIPPPPHCACRPGIDDIDGIDGIDGIDLSPSPNPTREAWLRMLRVPDHSSDVSQRCNDLMVLWVLWYCFLMWALDRRQSQTWESFQDSDHTGTSD